MCDRLTLFYSGQHFALKQLGVQFTVLGAFDINEVANRGWYCLSTIMARLTILVYKHNFPDTPVITASIGACRSSWLLGKRPSPRSPRSQRA
jgi:hypothetical protein